MKTNTEPKVPKPRNKKAEKHHNQLSLLSIMYNVNLSKVFIKFTS